MAVITISRQYGSGGNEIADQICSILGYTHFDKRQIARAAVVAGLAENEIATYSDFSEENYKVKKFLDFLLRRSHPPTRKQVSLEEKISTLVAEEQIFSESYAIALVQRAINAAYQTGNIVILGRGGQIILKDHPGVVHIRIVANLEDRIQRVEDYLKEAAWAHLAEIAISRTAQDLITERDKASADYIHQFYNTDWTSPSLYHAILNTSEMSIPQAAQIIVEMVRCLLG
jgi:CMP/dCMP kinase